MVRNIVAAIAMAALALLGGAGQALAETQLTIVSWGGAYSHSQLKAYHEPYLAANPGVSIINDESSKSAVAKMRAMEEAGNVTWDLVDVTAADAIRLCDEGLATPIDHDDVLAPAPGGAAATEDFGDLIISDCFIPQVVYSTAVGYRTDRVTTPPESICALFDLEKYPGKRGLEKRPLNNLEWALMCDGVAKDDIYQMLETNEGVRRAFRKLDTIRDRIIWWSDAAVAVELLATGEVVMASSYNGRLFSLIQEKKAPVAMLWDAQVFDLDGWIVPAGLSPQKLSAVLAYLRFATDTQRLADQAKYISYGPARASSIPLVSKHAELGIEMAPHMPNNPINSKNSFLTNYEWWADNRDDLDVRFQAWLSQ